MRKLSYDEIKTSPYPDFEELATGYKRYRRHRQWLKFRKKHTMTKGWIIFTIISFFILLLSVLLFGEIGAMLTMVGLLCIVEIIQRGINNYDKKNN